MAKVSELKKTESALRADELVISSASNGTRKITVPDFMKTAPKLNNTFTGNAITSDNCNVDVQNASTSNNICILNIELTTTVSVSAWATLFTINEGLRPYGNMTYQMMDVTGKIYPLIVRNTGVCSTMVAIPQGTKLYLCPTYFM